MKVHALVLIAFLTAVNFCLFPGLDQVVSGAALTTAPTVVFAAPESAQTHAMAQKQRAALTIKYEDFEGSFPNDWATFASSGYSDAYWGDESCNAYAGSWGGWCATYGSAAQSPCSNYLDNMSSWMTYGPFDLSDATSGALEFYYYLSIEAGYDGLFFGASTDGANFYGTTVSSNTGWTYASIDFNNVPGYGSMVGGTSVWVGFEFYSDSSNVVGDGAYLDEIYITKDTVSTGYVEITMNGTYFIPNDWVTTTVGYSLPSPESNVPLFVILDVYGYYYFAPSFSGYDYYWANPGPSIQYSDVIPGFYWPYGAGWASNLVWWAAMTDYNVTYLQSNVANWTFSFGEY